VDWNLLACARRHRTYAPTDPELRAHLTADTPTGPAWRCLRCGLYVLGPPHGEGPAEDAPAVLRGKELRDAVILRLLAVERYVRGLLLLFVAYLVFRFRADRDALRRAFEDDVPLVEPIARRLHWNLADSSFVHLIRQALDTDAGTLLLVAGGLGLYGLLQFVEGTGLWLLRRWGEYFAAVATSTFIPAGDLRAGRADHPAPDHRPGRQRGGGRVHRLPQAPVRRPGRGAACAAERHEESLLQVEQAARLAKNEKDFRSPGVLEK